jgi:hypothetical protein
MDARSRLQAVFLAAPADDDEDWDALILRAKLQAAGWKSRSASRDGPRDLCPAGSDPELTLTSRPRAGPGPAGV